MKQMPVGVANPKNIGGEPRFAGMCVPARALLDYLEGGDTVGEFLAQYPTVSRRQAVAFLELASAPCWPPSDLHLGIEKGGI